MSTFAESNHGTERVIGHGAETFDEVRLRRDALEASGVDGVLVPTRVALQAHDAVVVTEPAPAGVTLREILETRGALRAAECVWWAEQVAHILAALHKVGITHGALTADAVVIGDGRVWVGRLVDAVTEVTGPDDVAALGELLAHCVRPDESARVEAWAEPMRHERPDARPSAAMVARAIGSCAPAQPIAPLVTDVAGSMRQWAAASHEVERLPGTWWWRLRVAVRQRGALVAIGGGACIALGAAVTLGVALTSGGGSDGTQTAGGGSATGAAVHSSYLRTPVAMERPQEAAVRLTHERMTAMAESDGEALVAMTVPGGPAHEEADMTSRLFAEGRLSIASDGGALSPADVTVEVVQYEGGDAPPSHRAVVLVDYESPAYTVRLDADETYVAAHRTRVRMVLEWDARAGWRVVEASQALAEAAT